MKQKRRGRDKTRTEAIEVASATECTGLMPALPQDEASEAADAALYGVLPGKET